MKRGAKRRRWLWICCGWGAFWTLTLLGGFLPALLLAPASFALALLPVGMPDQYREMEEVLRKEFDR